MRTARRLGAAGAVLAAALLASGGARAEAGPETPPGLVSVVSEARGEGFDYSVRFYVEVSPWHDVPLENADGTLNFICEIPRGTSAKMEVATGEANNPIKQDTKNGELRFYPYDILWNYGLFPQTWEDPAHVDVELEVAGDNDPVDVVDIGDTDCEVGGIYASKVICCLAMVDDGELDWKMITINSAHPLFDAVNTVDDAEREFPGEIRRIREWFRDYKIPGSDPPAEFGYGGECLPTSKCHDVLHETRGFWHALVSGERENTEGLALPSARSYLS